MIYTKGRSIKKPEDSESRDCDFPWEREGRSEKQESQLRLRRSKLFFSFFFSLLVLANATRSPKRSATLATYVARSLFVLYGLWRFYSDRSVVSARKDINGTAKV